MEGFLFDFWARCLEKMVFFYFRLDPNFPATRARCLCYERHGCASRNFARKEFEVKE